MDVKVNLTDRAANREARISELEAELARSQATCTRLLQVGFCVNACMDLYVYVYLYVIRIQIG